jgi:hypothetical protein
MILPEVFLDFIYYQVCRFHMPRQFTLMQASSEHFTEYELPNSSYINSLPQRGQKTSSPYQAMRSDALTK